ncbi:hypothetical protein [Psychrobacter sp. I-STPA10]|uniref:hypothetical protein n=1 Tax=Psychrobacter sp. I-STPA10 TaxID=2585769 RepID=UPI001E3B59E3|nr:hypothetical protein [Psychrobacter sp. I-STPA10]
MIKVEMGEAFRSEFSNYPSSDKLKIAQFIRHVKQYGFEGLEGKNRRSDGFSNDDPLFTQKMDLVKKYNLWHYHIGIPNYEKSYSGDYKTSEYVLHYMKGDDYIRIVDISPHPPFKLPDESYLK